MGNRTNIKPTQEQIDAIIEKYSNKKKVLDFLIVGTFYLLYKKSETLDKVKNKFFRQCNPYKYSKREGIK